MAERPTPHSVAVCTLIALNSDPSSLIHKPIDLKYDLNERQEDTVKEGSSTVTSISLQDHLSKVIKNLVFTNDDEWTDYTNSEYSNSHGATMSLKKLLSLVSDGSSTGASHYCAKFLLDDLAQSCMSIDSLVDLFSALRSTVVKGIVDGDSAHGVYIRKRCLGFDELSFESLGRFWEAFCVYVGSASKWGSTEPKNKKIIKCKSSIANKSTKGKVSSTETHVENDLKQDSGETVQNEFKSFPSDESDEMGEESQSSSLRQQHLENLGILALEVDPSRQKWPLAPRQISRNLLQQCLSLHKQMDRLSYTQMEAQIQVILEENPELIMAHYLRFLNCAMHGERVGAMEHFHRYFDFAMIQERKDRLLWGTNVPLASNGGNGGENQNSPTSGSLHKNVVQYAAILLASLFHGFANDELSYLATEEAVRVAQQSGDGTCLAFALGWLHKVTVGSEGPTLNDPGNGEYGGAELLTRSVSRAAANNLRSLVAGASLLRATYFASVGKKSYASSATLPSTGDSFLRLNGAHPACVWESVAAASTEGETSNLNGNMIENTVISHDTPTLITNLDKSEDAMEIFAQQHLVSTAVWNSIGHISMASATAYLTMQCYKNYLSSEQCNYLSRELACSVMYGTGYETSFLQTKLSNETPSLSWSLEQLGLNGINMSTVKTSKTFHENVLSFARPSLYRKALEKLQELQSKRANPLNITVIMNEWSIRLFDLHAATSLNTLIYSLSPLASQDCILATIECMGQHSLLLSRRRNFEAAKDLILNRICPLCQRNRFIAHHAHYLLQAALIELDSKSDDPICALHLLLDCLALCEAHSMDSMHATTLSLLARLHLKFNHYCRAKAVLKAVLPMILQHAHVYFHGEAWLTMAKCSLGEVKGLVDEESKKPHKSYLLDTALSELDEAAIAFESLQDVKSLREIFYLQAHVCNSLKGEQAKRNEAARKFNEMNSRMVQSSLPLWYDAIASAFVGDNMVTSVM